MKKHKLNSFFSSYPLYRKFKAIESYDGNGSAYTNPSEFKGETFRYHCGNEGEGTTFEVELPSYTRVFWNNIKFDNQIPEEVFDEEHYLNYTHHLIGRCRSCKRYSIDLLLHVWSDKPMPSQIHQARTNHLLGGKVAGVIKEEDFLYDIYMEKIGVGPAQEIPISKAVSKYLDRESGSWYFKGNKALIDDYGIGAFAYFRRVIEKELIRIVRDLSELPSSDSDKISTLLLEYEETNKAHLLYKNVFKYLPHSLKALGDNPLEALYKYTSEGLHNMTDEECQERANVVNQVLEFVIKKIYEERSELSKVREALKKLKAK